MQADKHVAEEEPRTLSAGAASSDGLGDRGVFKVGVRIPPFWPEEPALWFAQMEGQFVLSELADKVYEIAPPGLTTAAVAGHDKEDALSQLTRQMAEMSRELAAIRSQMQSIPRYGERNSRSDNKVSSSENIFMDSFLDDLPKLPSHYCRQRTSLLYLQPEIISKQQLYTLYKEKCNSIQVKPLSTATFSNALTFKKISLFKPKKDQEQSERFILHHNTQPYMATLPVAGPRFVFHARIPIEF